MVSLFIHIFRYPCTQIIPIEYYYDSRLTQYNLMHDYKISLNKILFEKDRYFVIFVTLKEQVKRRRMC